MRVDCECGKALKVNDKLIGKRIRCPGCGSALLVEAASGAIAAGRPGAAPTVADDTPPPRKRRVVVEEDEPAPALRKRARAADLDDDDEDDRPRRKKKPKKSGGVPLLLIFGGLAAVVLLVLLAGGGLALYFLVLRKGSDAAVVPTTGPGSKNEPVAIKFRVPAKVGQAYDFNVVADTQVKNLAQPGFDLGGSAKVVIEGTAKALRVDASGKETSTELNLAKLSINTGKGDVLPVAPKTIVVRDVHAAGVTYTVKGGARLGLEANQALEEIYGKGIKEENLDEDQAFGTSEKKVVGDSWPVKKSAFVQGINKSAGGMMSIKEDSVSGTVKFSSVSEEGGIAYLNFDIAVTIKQSGTPINAGPGGQGSLNINLNIDMSYRIPADYSTGPVRYSEKLNMNLEGTGQGLGGAVERISLSITRNKTGTRKYQSGSGKNRAELVLPPAAGRPRLDLALGDGPVWEARRDLPALAGHRHPADAATAKR